MCLDSYRGCVLFPSGQEGRITYRTPPAFHMSLCTPGVRVVPAMWSVSKSPPTCRFSAERWARLSCSHFLTCILAAVLLSLNAVAGHAQDTSGWLRVKSWGFHAGFGEGDRHGVKFYSLLPHIDLSLPKFIDEPLARYDLHAQWVVEPFASYVTNNTSETVEAGANLLFFSLRYDRGQQFVPFIEGGEGALYTGLRDHALGTHFQFSSQIGGGLEWFFTRTAALSVMYRFRHISNAGISRQNSGMNTNFAMLGFSYFPGR